MQRLVARIMPLLVLALGSSLIVVPGVLVAWLTGKMVYVVPTVAAAVFFASGLSRAVTLYVENVEDASTATDFKTDYKTDYKSESLKEPDGTGD